MLWESFPTGYVYVCVCVDVGREHGWDHEYDMRYDCDGLAAPALWNRCSG